VTLRRPGLTVLCESPGHASGCGSTPRRGRSGPTLRQFHAGTLDAAALADEVAMADPISALDGPELHVRAIVPQADEQPLILLLVDWPAHPG
jgi:hypothetical protein